MSSIDLAINPSGTTPGCRRGERHLAPKTLLVQLVGANHQLAKTQMQSFTQLEQGRICRIAPSANKRANLLDGQAGVGSYGLMCHIGVFGDHQFDRLTQRGVAKTTRLGGPRACHELQTYAFPPQELRQRC
jgi:hypothetical protein